MRMVKKMESWAPKSAEARKRELGLPQVVSLRLHPSVRARIDSMALTHKLSRSAMVARLVELVDQGAALKS